MSWAAAVSGRLFVWDGKLLEKGCKTVLVESTLSDGDRGIVEELAEEHQSGVESGALVSIQEWLILRDMESVGGRHLKEIRMEELSGEGRRRRRDRRIESTRIAQAIRPAEKA